MRPSPYAPPKSDVSSEAFEEPPQFQRAKWLFSGLWFLLTVLPLWNALLEAPPAPSMRVLLLNSLLALGLAALLARDMWLLKARRFPLMVDLSVYAIIFGGLLLLVVIKETKAYVWNSLHLDVPVFLLMGFAALAAWVTEARKSVRIYIGARSLIFVPAKTGP